VLWQWAAANREPPAALVGVGLGEWRGYGVRRSEEDWEGGSEGGREGEREGEREGGGWKEGEREGGRDREKERGKGGRRRDGEGEAFIAWRKAARTGEAAACCSMLSVIFGGSPPPTNSNTVGFIARAGLRVKGDGEVGGWVGGCGGWGGWEGGGARDGREGISVEMVRGWIECAERHKF
jgi:hypothetical protein